MKLIQVSRKMKETVVTITIEYAIGDGATWSILVDLERSVGLWISEGITGTFQVVVRASQQLVVVS